VLDKSIIDDRQRLAVTNAKNHHQAAPSSRLHAILLLGIAIRPVNNVGLHSNRKHADLPARAFHRPPTVVAIRSIARHPNVEARPVNRIAFKQIVITVL
jgi:hypothetical protein